MKQRLTILSLMLVMALLLAACGSAAPTTEAPAEGAPAAEAPAEEATDAPAAEAPAEAPAEEAAATDAPAEEAAEEAASPADAEIQLTFTEECNESYEGESLTVYQQAGLTGALASILGDGFINGTADALSAINDAGGVCGVMLDVRLEDTQYAPDQEIAVYEQYRAEDPKPIFVLTYGSGATIALKDRVVEDQIVNIAAGLNAEAFYNPADGWTVGVAPIYSDQFAGFLQFVHDNWADIKPEGAGDDIVVGVVGWANSFGAGATTPEALAFADSLGITVLPLEEQPIDPAADVTGQLQNLLLNGANVIYTQALSFGPAQVIGTIHALGFWDQVVFGGVNWAMNQDVLNILGDNAALAQGMYGVFPYLYWNDDAPGAAAANASFEAGGYPETDKGVGYILSYGSIFAVADILQTAMNEVGFDGMTGEAFFDAMKGMGTVSAAGLYTLDVQGSNRAPQQSQIRQVQMTDDGLQFVVVEDFFTLPDTRP